MKISKKIIILFFLIGFLAFGNSHFAQAAQFKFGSQSIKAEVGEQLKVDFFLNTEQESINAVEGQLIFSNDFLNLKKIQDGNSIVNFWVEKPKLSAPGNIFFSGITPGGIISENALIFSLIFEVKDSGEASIDIVNARALLNDGEGSMTVSSVLPLQIIALASNKNTIPVDIQVADNVSPEAFNPEIAQDKNIFAGQNFIVFATQDKGSGIASYQAKETRYKFLAFLKKWQIAESPYLLKDQSLHSYIFVKAIDLNGNEKISITAPKYSSVLNNNYPIYVIIVLSLFVIIIWIFLRRKKMLKK